MRIKKVERARRRAARRKRLATRWYYIRDLNISVLGHCDMRRFRGNSRVVRGPFRRPVSDARANRLFREAAR